MLKKYINRYHELPIQIKASIWFLVCCFLQKGISFITTPIFTRLMSTDEYGSYNVIISWESLISIFITLNLSYGVYGQGLVKFEKDRKRFSSSLQGLTLLLVLFWTCVYIIFHNWIDRLLSYNFVYMMLIITYIWSSAVFGFWASEQRVEFKYKKLVIVTILVSIFSPLLSIILMNFLENKVLARLLGMVIVSFIAYFWMFFKQMYDGKVLFSKKYWGHALAFNIPLIPHYLSQTVLGSSDRIMIEKIVDSSKAGIYSLAYSISLIMTLFNTALMQTISPWLYKKIKDKKINDISKVAYFSLIIIAIVNIILISFAPEAVKIFAPKEYYDAIWVIPPVAMSAFFMYAYDLFAKFEFYYEKTKLIASATVIGAILNIVLNYIFIGKYGYYAAGYTTLICYMIYAIAHYIFMRKVCRENCDNVQPYDTKKLLLITILFLTIGFMLLFLYKYTILRYLVIVIFLLGLLLKRKYLLEQIKYLINTKKI